MEFVFREWDTEFRELLREYPGNIRELLGTDSPKLLNPGICLGFFGELGGKAVRFYLGLFSGDCPPSLCGFFKVLSVLGFLFGGFFGTNFGMGVRSFWGGFLGPKMPLFASRKRQ